MFKRKYIQNIMSCIKKLLNLLHRPNWGVRIHPIDNSVIDDTVISDLRINNSIILRREQFNESEFQSIMEDISLQTRSKISITNNTSHKKETHKKNYKCPICLEKLSKDTPSKIICKNKKCKTHYHHKCITQWNKNKPPGDLKCLVCTLKTIKLSIISRPSCLTSIQYSRPRSRHISGPTQMPRGVSRQVPTSHRSPLSRLREIPRQTSIPRSIPNSTSISHQYPRPYAHNRLFNYVEDSDTSYRISNRSGLNNNIPIRLRQRTYVR
jgi:hypothetical protein